MFFEYSSVSSIFFRFLNGSKGGRLCARSEIRKRARTLVCRFESNRRIFARYRIFKNSARYPLARRVVRDIKNASRMHETLAVEYARAKVNDLSIVEIAWNPSNQRKLQEQRASWSFTAHKVSRWTLDTSLARIRVSNWSDFPPGRWLIFWRIFSRWRGA